MSAIARWRVQAERRYLGELVVGREARRVRRLRRAALRVLLLQRVDALAGGVEVEHEVHLEKALDTPAICAGGLGFAAPYS